MVRFPQCIACQSLWTLSLRLLNCYWNFILVPGAAYFSRRSWYLSRKSAFGSNWGGPNAGGVVRLCMKPSHSRSGETGPKVFEDGVLQAPSRLTLFSGAICRLNATKQTMIHPQTMAKINRPATSTGKSNSTAFMLSESVIARRIPNEIANNSHNTIKSSRYVYVFTSLDIFSIWVQIGS